MTEVLEGLAFGLQLQNLESCHLKHWVWGVGGRNPALGSEGAGKSQEGVSISSLLQARQFVVKSMALCPRLVHSMYMIGEDRRPWPLLQVLSRKWGTKQSHWAYWGHIPMVEGQIDNVSAYRTVL